MKRLNKLAFFDYPDFLVFVDRFCPLCGAPVSVKIVNGMEVETCLNPECPYLQVREKEESSRNSH